MPRRCSHLAILSLALLAGPVLLATGCADDESAQADFMTDQTQPVVIDESGDGQTFDVLEGQQIIVLLPGNPSTGYRWEVVSTDDTLGYPAAENYEPQGDDPMQAGGGGTFELVWWTQGSTSMIGQHIVALAYRRPWDNAEAGTFSFTVDIAAGSASAE